MRKERFSVLIVRPKAELPALPLDLRKFIELEKMRDLDEPEIEIPIDRFDLYKLSGAKADFRGQGVKLLAHHAEKAVKWIDDALTIFGINGHGRLKLNHRFCEFCQDNTRIKEVSYDHENGVRVILYICRIHRNASDYKDIEIKIPSKKTKACRDFDSSTIRRSTNPRHSHNRNYRSAKK